jgi:Zn-dependent peptidase ImmA (M78 family)
VRSADTERARRAARAVVAEFGVKAPPVPVERIIKAKKIVLQYAPLDEDLSGMAFIKDGVGIIGINALHHPNRQRFSAAHELAHHELHADDIRNEVHVDRAFKVLRRDDLAAQGVDPWEIEANAFAAELLMPQMFLAEAIDAAGLDLDDETKVNSLARRFKVSASALRFRLTNRD